MKVLMSAETSFNNDQDNSKATKHLANWLTNRGYTYTPCIGVYKGKKETSFMINVTNCAALDSLKQLSGKLHQECILTMMDNGENACLINSRGMHEFIGTFKRVMPFYAKQQDSYTIWDGGYYVAE